MKTTIKLITATIFATMFISISSMAHIENSEEGYIDDIPFNTHDIAMEASLERSRANFTFEEETYIDDIPFNTEVIASDICCDRELRKTYILEDESYIDDIPFDTAEIAGQLLIEEEASPMTLNCNEKNSEDIL